MTSRVLTMKTAPPLAVNTSRVLTKKTANSPGGFHEDWTKMLLVERTAPPPCRHVFLRTGTIFELSLDIIGTNILTKKTVPPPGRHFREDWTTNITPGVFKRIYYSHITKTAPPLAAMFF
ncbi:hypothetical protein DPMN_112706 [Dreissena polymorpha]|uniref:Uncharacterized protein n=1 Tax=Dreissena polymorpha TaxID=45954 RepID=A0A9D4QR56_DREPO|nr:hypothetical protein DPMN_112706 [Dreissena polymorpha]